MFTDTWVPSAVTISQMFLKTLPGFPHVEYQKMLDLYEDLRMWYSGEKLIKFDVDVTSGKKVELYPLRINPLRATAEKHVTVLLGESGGSVDSGGLPIKVNVIGKTKRNKPRELELEKILSQTMLNSNMGSVLQHTAMESQYMGGSVYSVDWLPELKTVRLTPIHPREFLGEVYGRDNWRLKKAWIVKPIAYDEAVALGVDEGEYLPYWYTEYWTEDEYIIRVNLKVLEVNGVKLQGRNVFGVVPIVYIPHIRTTQFYGDSMITETVKGLIKEMNLRMADIGDAISEDAHSLTYIKNVKGSVQLKKVAGSLPVYDLGSRQSIGQGEPDPAMETLKKQSASATMIEWNERLIDAYRREVNHPAVADGEDEGSQRSSLTLTTRMWPLLSHVKLERQNFSDGFRSLLTIALKVMAIKGVNGITQEDLDINIFISWSPMIGKDREMLLQEIAIRREHDLGSQHHMLELLEDVRDIDDEITLINDELEQKAELIMKENAAKSSMSASNPKSKS